MKIKITQFPGGFRLNYSLYFLSNSFSTNVIKGWVTKCPNQILSIYLWQNNDHYTTSKSNLRKSEHQIYSKPQRWTHHITSHFTHCLSICMFGVCLHLHLEPIIPKRTEQANHWGDLQVKTSLKNINEELLNWSQGFHEESSLILLLFLSLFLGLIKKTIINQSINQ